jgi:hypothetical protein
MTATVINRWCAKRVESCGLMLVHPSLARPLVTSFDVSRRIGVLSLGCSAGAVQSSRTWLLCSSATGLLERCHEAFRAELLSGSGLCYYSTHTEELVRYTFVHPVNNLVSSRFQRRRVKLPIIQE